MLKTEIEIDINEATPADNSASEFWTRFQNSWHDSSIDLEILRREVRIAFELRKTDPVLRMLLDRLNMDLGPDECLP